MVEKEIRRAVISKDDILQDLERIPAGLQSPDGTLPPHHLPILINEKLCIICLAAEAFGDERGTLIADGINKLRKLYPDQERHLKEKVSELLETYALVEREEVPAWVFEPSRR